MAEWPNRVNITGLPVWIKNWDPAGAIGMHASDAAHEDFSRLNDEFLEILIYEILQVTKPAFWRKDGLERHLAQAIPEYPELFEETRNSILDAMTWATEEAVTPSDEDIRWALEKTAAKMKEEFRFEMDLDDLLGETAQPGDVGGVSRGEVFSIYWDPRWREYSLDHLMNSLYVQTDYVRKENHYDRYLWFRWMDSSVVRYLLSKMDADRKKTFLYELKVLQDDYVSTFSNILLEQTEDIDVSNRSNFKKFWRQQQADKKLMRAATQEMREYLKDNPIPEEP